VKKKTTILPIILIVSLVLCYCLVILVGGAIYVSHKFNTVLPTLWSTLAYQPATSVPTATPPIALTREPPGQIPTEALTLLEQTIVPENDLTVLACRFKGVCNLPATLPPPAQPLSIGDQQTFWVNNEDTRANLQVTATLRYITPHVYFWVENTAHYNASEMKQLVDAFENKIYPTDRAFFGSEWTPGVDDDPHIYILYSGNLGSSVGGYFSSPDEYLPQVRKYSNAHEMFYINSSENLADPYTYGTLAHEFQHMIHWNQDRNEGALLNEGFSELATFLNKYDNGNFDTYYLSNPDINLTDWLGTAGANTAHYGANFLFVDYFLNRFGEETTKALVHDQQNGLDSLDDVFKQQNITDPLTGKVITADDFFLDWTIANFVQDGSVGDGRYTYQNYPNAPHAIPTETVSNCPADNVTRTVNEYGVDYIKINCSGAYTLHFEGATSTRLLPIDPHSGSYMFWSNMGDESDMTLTRQFDLTAVSGPVNISYWTWYDIEQDYDYVYVEASTDGEHWDILKTPSGTDYDPNGGSYGWGYTGPSNDWIQETVDLSKYAGQKVSIRFEYITDPAVNGAGFVVDDISVPAIQYSTDFETDDGGWQANGFARVENTLPQTFRLALITHASGNTIVTLIPVAADQAADIPLSIGENGVTDVVLVVTGTTRFTREVAPYQFAIH